jgi:hypothetical protein
MISKNQTFEIMTLITDFYDQFEINQNKIDSWHLILKNEDFDKVKHNLFDYSNAMYFHPK